MVRCGLFGGAPVGDLGQHQVRAVDRCDDLVGRRDPAPLRGIGAFGGVRREGVAEIRDRCVVGGRDTARRIGHGVFSAGAIAVVLVSVVAGAVIGPRRGSLVGSVFGWPFCALRVGA